MSARMSLGSFASDLGLDLQTLDAQLAEMIGTEVESACPDQANLILGRTG